MEAAAWTAVRTYWTYPLLSGIEADLVMGRKNGLQFPSRSRFYPYNIIYP